MALIALLALIISIIPSQSVWAGVMSSQSDKLTTHTKSTLSSHTISFALSASNTFATGETITADFDEDGSKFAVDGANSVIGDFDFNDGVERTILTVTGSGAPVCTGHIGTDHNDIAVGINDTTGVVTFLACADYTASGAGAVVTIEYGTAATTGGTGVNRVTNPTSAGNDIVINIGGTNGDTGAIATSIIDNDQVNVTATVTPTFTFILSSSTCALGTLTTGGVATCNYNVTTTTNATTGYATTIVEDGNLRDGLGNDINDVAGGNNVTAGTEGYGIRTTGTDGQYNAADTAITGTAKLIATDTSGPIDAQLVTVTHKAAISGTTVAGSYSHLVTLVSTGTF